MLRSVINSLGGRVCILAADGTILSTNDSWDADTSADGDAVFIIALPLHPPVPEAATTAKLIGMRS